MSFDNNHLNAEPGALASDRNREYYEAMYTSDEEEDESCCICGESPATGLVKVGQQWICEKCEDQPENNYDPNADMVKCLGCSRPINYMQGTCPHCGYIEFR